MPPERKKTLCFCQHASSSVVIPRSSSPLAPFSTWLSLRSHWDGTRTCWELVLTEVRSPYVRDTSGGAPSTLSTTPLTLIPMLSLVGWYFTFYFSVGFTKFLSLYSTLKQPALLFIQCQYFCTPKEMTVSVSHCFAAPHKSRGALQLCPTFKGWKQSLSPKTQH